MFLKFRDYPYRYDLALGIHAFLSRSSGKRLDQNSGKSTSEYNGLQHNACMKANKQRLNVCVCLYSYTSNQLEARNVLTQEPNVFTQMQIYTQQHFSVNSVNSASSVEEGYKAVLTII